MTHRHNTRANYRELLRQGIDPFDINHNPPLSRNSPQQRMSFVDLHLPDPFDSLRGSHLTQLLDDLENLDENRSEHNFSDLSNQRLSNLSNHPPYYDPRPIHPTPAPLSDSPRFPNDSNNTTCQPQLSQSDPPPNPYGDLSPNFQKALRVLDQMQSRGLRDTFESCAVNLNSSQDDLRPMSVEPGSCIPASDFNAVSSSHIQSLTNSISHSLYSTSIYSATRPNPTAVIHTQALPNTFPQSLWSAPLSTVTRPNQTVVTTCHTTTPPVTTTAVNYTHTKDPRVSYTTTRGYDPHSLPPSSPTPDDEEDLIRRLSLLLDDRERSTNHSPSFPPNLPTSNSSHIQPLDPSHGSSKSYPNRFHGPSTFHRDLVQYCDRNCGSQTCHPDFRPFHGISYDLHTSVPSTSHPNHSQNADLSYNPQTSHPNHRLRHDICHDIRHDIFSSHTDQGHPHNLPSREPIRSRGFVHDHRYSRPHDHPRYFDPPQHPNSQNQPHCTTTPVNNHINKPSSDNYMPPTSNRLSSPQSDILIINNRMYAPLDQTYHPHLTNQPHQSRPLYRSQRDPNPTNFQPHAYSTNENYQYQDMPGGHDSSRYSPRNFHPENSHNHKSGPSTSNNPLTMSLSLPPMEIEKFDGDYSQYKEFKIKVQSILASCNYSEEMKVIYLKKHLTGEPADIVAGVMPDDPGAYGRIWIILDEDYGTPQLGLDHHMAALLDLKTWPECKSMDDLRKLYRHVSVHYESLKHYGTRAMLEAEATKVLILSLLTGYAAKRVTRLRELKSSYNLESILKELKAIISHSKLISCTKSICKPTKVRRAFSVNSRRYSDASSGEDGDTSDSGDLTCLHLKSSIKKDDPERGRKKSVTFERNNSSQRMQRYRSPSRSPSPEPLRCPFCQTNDHSVNECKLYDNRDAYWNHIYKNRWCSNCLRPRHTWKTCFQPQSCNTGCNRSDKHVSVLCDKYYK